MRKIILTSLVLPLLSACHNQNNAVTTLPEGYLAANVRLFAPAATSGDASVTPNTAAATSSDTTDLPVDSPLLRSIRRSEIMDSLQSMKIAFRTSYIGYYTKKNLMGKSGDEVFAECEQQFSTAPERLSSSEYYDLVRQCLSKFKDGHLSFGGAIRQSYIGTGIESITPIGEKYYIAAIRPNLLKKFEEISGATEGALSQKVKAGFEVIKINQRPASEEVDLLKNYITGSSDLAQTENAASIVFQRRFAYPPTASVTLLLKDPEQSAPHEVTLPWVQLLSDPRSASIETRQILSHRGIRRIFELGQVSTLLESTGFTLYGPLFKNLQNKQEFVSTEDDSDVLMTTGIAQVNQQAVCYLKLNTFSLDESDSGAFNVKKKSPTGNTVTDLVEAFSNHLAGCEAFNSPLILDLRFNGGGNAALADKLLRLFEKENTPKLFSAGAHLNEPGNISYLLNLLNRTDTTHASLEDRVTYETVIQTVQQDKPISDWIVSYSLVGARSVFSKKLIVLISPDCVSACENTAAKLKNSQRAILVGRPAHGTGFGFSTAGGAGTKFNDPLQFFDMEIPNKAFQSVVLPDTASFRSDARAMVSVVPLSQIQFMENHPTTPHIIHENTLNDLKSNGENPDYIRRIGEILADTASTSGPTP